MTIIPLSDVEWEEINSQLPDVNPLGYRIIELPNPDWLPLQVYVEDSDRLRSSNVCLRDASKFLGRAHLALRLAVGIRKYHMAQSQSERDEAWLLAHFDSQFYADYVPLLLYSSSEHSLNALSFLFDLARDENDRYKKPPLPKAEKKGEKKYIMLEAILKDVQAHPKASNNLFDKLQKFNMSLERKKIWEYRNDWVHNKPMRMASPFYDPPRKRRPDTETIQGAIIYRSERPNYTWEKLIDRLKQALSDTHELLTVCVDEWDRHFIESSTIE